MDKKAFAMCMKRNRVKQTLSLEDLEKLTGISIEKLVEQYRMANQSAVRGQVVFTGSSMMEMFPIEQWAKELGEDAPSIYNRGVGGYKTTDLLPILDVCVLELKPKKVLSCQL